MAHLVRQDHINSALRIVSTLREVEELKFTVTQAAKGSAIIAGCAFIGGLLGGNKGLALGAILGGTATALAQTPYKSAVDIICNDLTAAQKQILFNELRNTYAAFDSADLSSLQTLLTSQVARDAITQLVLGYLTQQGYHMLTAA